MRNPSLNNIGKIAKYGAIAGGTGLGIAGLLGGVALYKKVISPALERNKWMRTKCSTVIAPIQKGKCLKYVKDRMVSDLEASVDKCGNDAQCKKMLEKQILKIRGYE